MKRYIHIQIIVLVTTISSYAQDYGDTLYVMAYNGVNLRAQPNTTSEKVDALPFGAAVMYCSDSVDDRFEARNGRWIEIEYNYQSCYVFDGFLSDYPTPKSRKMTISQLGNYITKTYGGEITNIVQNKSISNGDDSDEKITHFKSGLTLSHKEYPGTTYWTYAFPKLRSRDLINIIDLAFSNYNKDNKTLISHFEEDDFWKKHDPNDICPGAFPVKLSNKIDLQYDNMRKSMAIDPIPKIIISQSKY